MSSEAIKVKPEMIEEFDNEFYQMVKLVLLEIRTHSPFFGILATEMWIAGPTKSVPTVSVSPKGVVVYNEEFLKSKTMGEIVAILVHESLHVALDYWDRFKGSNWEIANWAHDFAINDIVVTGLGSLVITRKDGRKVDFQIKLPKGTLWDSKYKNMSAEEIYNILNKGVKEMAENFTNQLRDQLKDPAARAEYERQQKINKLLRESLVKGAQKLGEAEKLAMTEAQKAKEKALAEASASHNEFLDAIRNKEGLSLGGTTEVEEFNPHDKKDDPKPADSSPDEGAESTPGSDANEPESDNGSEPQAADQDQQNQANDDQVQEGIKESRDQLQQDMHNAMHDYMGKERDRIESEMDGQPNGSTREQHLEELEEQLKDIAEDYVDKMSKEPEQSDDAADENSAGEPGEGESADKGDGEPQSDTSNSQESKSHEGQPGNPGQGQPGSAGQGQPGQSGQPQPGQGNQPVQGFGGEPGQGQGQGHAGQPQSGQSGQPGSRRSGQGHNGKPPLNEGQARDHVKDALKDMMDQVSNALNGKRNSMQGLDQSMASGEDMMSQGAMEKAMREMAKELGLDEKEGMVGDINLDCSDIPGNPFTGETPEQTRERKKQTLQRAVVGDAQAGGKAIGSLPGWLSSEIEGILHPPLRFTQKMKRYFGKFGRKDHHSFKIANHRNTFFKHTMVRPGTRKNTSKAYIIDDTSGSMLTGADLDNLRKSMGLVDRLATAQQMEVEVIQCDTKVTKVMTTREVLAEISKRKFELRGQGGSNLTPAFEYAWESMMRENQGRGNVIVVFTDGEIVVPDKPPKGINQQVLWVTNRGQRPPTTEWGEHVVMDDL